MARRDLSLTGETLRLATTATATVIAIVIAVEVEVAVAVRLQTLLAAPLTLLQIRMIQLKQCSGSARRAQPKWFRIFRWNDSPFCTGFTLEHIT